MTTIAYRNSVMAGDTQVEWAGEGSGICAGYECKVFRFTEGLIATSGEASQGTDYMRWFQEGMRGDPQFADDDIPLDFHALIILNDGSMWKCEDGSRMARQLGTFCAIGSGYSGAMAAMRMGASAYTAVKIASEYDPATGGEIISVKLAKLS